MPFDAIPYALNSAPNILPGVNGLALNQNARCAQAVEQAYAFFNELGPYAADLGAKNRIAKSSGTAWKPNPTVAGFGAKLAGSTGYFAAVGHQLRSWSRECLFVYGASGQQAISIIAEAPGSSTTDRSLGVDPSSKLRSYIYDGAARTLTGTTTLIAGRVYHAAVTVSDSLMTLHLDGVAQGSLGISNAGYQGYSTPELVFGYGENNDGAIGASGTIFWSIEYNRALTEEEVRHRYLNQMEMFRLADELPRVGVAGGGGAILSPTDLADSLAFETPIVSQAHVLSAADAFFAENLETPVLTQTHFLPAVKAFFAERFNTAGMSQAHMFAPHEMNFAFPFDPASLGINAQSPSGFRTTGISNNSRRKNTSSDARGAQMPPAGRSQSITE